VNEVERARLAGMIQARGKMYASTRGTPVFEVEVSFPTAELQKVFGNPTERNYYGRTTYRYSSQSREFIAETLEGLLDVLSPQIRPRAEKMIEFCNGDEKARENAAKLLRNN
jgi:hypothetical protein